jgi:hypothetical protein
MEEYKNKGAFRKLQISFEFWSSIGLGIGVGIGAGIGAYFSLTNDNYLLAGGGALGALIGGIVGFLLKDKLDTNKIISFNLKLNRICGVFNILLALLSIVAFFKTNNKIICLGAILFFGFGGLYLLNKDKKGDRTRI